MSYFRNSPIIIAIFVTFSCSSPSESPNSRYHTQSAAFNQLLDAAPIIEVNLDTVPIDTVWLEPDNMRCNISDPEYQKDSEVLIYNGVPANQNDIALTTNIGLGLLSWEHSRFTIKHFIGKGPGEVDNFAMLNRHDTLITTHNAHQQFVKVYDLNLRYIKSYYDIEYSVHGQNDILYQDLLITLTRPFSARPGIHSIMQKELEKNGVNAKREHIIFGPIMDSRALRQAENGVSFSMKNGIILAKYLSTPFLFVSDLTGAIDHTIFLNSPRLGIATEHDPQVPMHEMGTIGPYPDHLFNKYQLHPNGDITLIISGAFHYLKKEGDQYIPQWAKTFLPPSHAGTDLQPPIYYFHFDFDHKYVYFTHPEVPECIFRVEGDWL